MPAPLREPKFKISNLVSPFPRTFKNKRCEDVDTLVTGVRIINSRSLPATSVFALVQMTS